MSRGDSNAPRSSSSPGLVEEVVQIDGQMVVTGMRPEVDQPLIPIIQSHGPLPQVVLSSSYVSYKC